MPTRDFPLIGPIAFLRQAVCELRYAASHERERAEALRHIAHQLAAEADDLAEATASRRSGLSEGPN